MKVTDLHRMKHDNGKTKEDHNNNFFLSHLMVHVFLVPSCFAHSDDSDNDEMSDDDDDDDLDEDPILDCRSVKHNGCVNRVRAMPQQPHIVSTWSDTSGTVEDVYTNIKCI